MYKKNVRYSVLTSIFKLTENTNVPTKFHKIVDCLLKFSSNSLLNERMKEH